MILPTARRSVARSSASLLLVLLLGLAAGSPRLRAQAAAPSGPYQHRNGFGVFFAYSPDSSHILMGAAEQRQLAEAGVSYTRGLLANHTVRWQYNGEFLPLAFESDPLARLEVQQVKPTVKSYFYDENFAPEQCANAPVAFSYTFKGVVYAGTSTIHCHDRQWSIGQAISPVGFQWNFLPERRLQPFLVGHGGYMYSTRPIPVTGAGSFNFTFDFGLGVEFFRSSSRSLRAEYRFHHISNHNSAGANPGIDNGLFQLSYVFGK